MFQPIGWGKDIFSQRYAINKKETWEEACRRVSRYVSSAEFVSDNKVKYEQDFYDELINNRFMPGGRIWYGSGRKKANLLNCFVIDAKDSRESWGKSTADMLVISGLGGGVGINFSKIRPKGEKIKGTGGYASGPLSLMKIINNVGEEIKTGGGRRVALMFCLNIDHPDILDFLKCKYSKKAKHHEEFLEEWQYHFVRASNDPEYLDALNIMLQNENSKEFLAKMFKLLNDKRIQNANVSVVIPEGQMNKFIDAIKNDLDWEFKWKGKIKKKIKAKVLWELLINHAYESAEPGILNFDLAERTSNISYAEKITSTNPCLAKNTLVTTKKGLFPIQDLIGKEVEIWDGNQWTKVDNFRVTGENQEMLKIELQDGSVLRCTSYHNFILSDGSIKKAIDLKVNDELKESENIPEIHGDIQVKGAYLKGFILGDGFYSDEDVILPLYDSKWDCKDRLLQSALEIPADKSYNGIAKDLGFTEPNESRSDRMMMHGLNLRRNELKSFGLEYKQSLPKEIYQWNLESKKEFIAGLFDSDGTAQDTKNAYGYQFWSIHLDFIRDLQLLLKTIGVKSRIDCSKKAGFKDFNDGYGSYYAQNCYRLTISQRYSIALAKQVKFARLKDFSSRETKYNVRLKHNFIKSISEDGIDEKVYCCTVPTNNQFSCNYAILLGNCGEIPMQPNSVCCLGSLVLTRFFIDNHFKYDLLEKTIKNSVRFLDNVLTINRYPTKDIKKSAQKYRRIGLGIMGLHDLLLMMGYKYSSNEGLKFVDNLMWFIKNCAYRASVDLAKEKGNFKAFDFEGYSKSEFYQNLDETLKDEIKQYGIRNCALLSIAPTGTISSICGVTSGIEPIFAYAYKRKYFKNDKLEVENIIHPLYREFIENNKSVDHFQSSYDLSVKDHLEIQKVCQKHIDQAISKCVEKNTLIATNLGIFPIQDLLDKNNIEPDNFYLPNKNYKVIDENGDLKKITNVYYGGIKSCYKIKFSNGYELIASSTHKLKTEFGWKSLEELQLKDRILYLQTDCINTNDLVGIPLIFKNKICSFKDFSFPKELTESYAKFLGMWLADGSLSINGISICEKNKEVREEITRLIPLIFNRSITVSLDKRSGVLNHSLGSKDLSKYFSEQYGFNSLTKKAPKEILISPKNVQMAFLEGLSLDGYIASDGNLIIYEGYSKQIVNTVAAILASWGVEYHIGTKKVKGGRLSDYVYSIKAFFNGNIISPIELHKQKYKKNGKLQRPIFVSKEQQMNILSQFPHSIWGSWNRRNWLRSFKNGNCVRDSFIERLKFENSIDTRFTVVSVTDIEFVGSHEVYDIEVEDTHSYLLNGLVSHNTINIPANYPKEELYDLFLDYLPYLKGLTMYVDGSRGGAPLESLSFEEASQLVSCPKGVCEIG